MDTVLSVAKYVIQIAVILFILVTAYALYLALNKTSQLKRWKKIDTGMSKDEMLNIMGNGYRSEKSENEEDTEIYTWEANAGKSYKGIRRVEIKVRKGKVVKVSHS